MDAARPAGEIRAAERPIGDVDGRLGDAVHVDQPRPLVAVAVEPGPQSSRVERLAAEDHLAQVEVRRGAPRSLGRDELAEGRRRLVEHRDPLAREQLVERLGRAAHLVAAPRPAGRRRAARPRSPRPRSRRRRSGTASRRRPAPKPNHGSVAVEQPRHVAVGDHHALRPARRARGVDHVGRVLAARSSDAGLPSRRRPPRSCRRRAHHGRRRAPADRRESDVPGSARTAAPLSSSMKRQALAAGRPGSSGT